MSCTGSFDTLTLGANYAVSSTAQLRIQTGNATFIISGPINTWFTTNGTIYTFTSALRVFLQITSGTDASYITTAVTATTTTGFTFRVNQPQTVASNTYTIHWLAIGTA